MGKEGREEALNIKIIPAFWGWWLRKTHRAQDGEVWEGRWALWHHCTWEAGCRLNKELGVWGYSSTEKTGLENLFSGNSYRLRSNRTSSKKKKKARTKKCSMGTHCTSQWLSNSFFSTLADILDIWSKDLVFVPESSTPGDLSRLLLPASPRCPQTPVGTFPQGCPTGQPCSGLCSQHCIPMALAQAHSPRISPPYQSLLVQPGCSDSYTEWVTSEVYLKSI